MFFTKNINEELDLDLDRLANYMSELKPGVYIDVIDLIRFCASDRNVRLLYDIKAVLKKRYWHKKFK